MRLNWADQAPNGISFSSEENILTRFEDFATSLNYKVVDSKELDYDTRSLADLVIVTDDGQLLFGVRQKSHNGTARIDIETRPSFTYRTRHVILQQLNGHDWELRNDSDLSEGEPPQSPEEFQALVTKLLAR